MPDCTPMREKIGKERGQGGGVSVAPPPADTRLDRNSHECELHLFFYSNYRLDSPSWATLSFVPMVANKRVAASPAIERNSIG